MAKKVVMIVGTVFILVGLLGFFLESPLFGMFEVNAVHNWIHLITGVLAYVAWSKGEGASRMFAQIFGVVYALVTVLGFAMNGNVLGLFHANAADNVLHLVLAVVLLWAGFAPARGSNPVPPSSF